eukprot:760695-Rhodomonas_salina.1
MVLRRSLHRAASQELFRQDSAREFRLAMSLSRELSNSNIQRGDEPIPVPGFLVSAGAKRARARGVVEEGVVEVGISGKGARRETVSCAVRVWRCVCRQV